MSIKPIKDAFIITPYHAVLVAEQQGTSLATVSYRQTMRQHHREREQCAKQHSPGTGFLVWCLLNGREAKKDV